MLDFIYKMCTNTANILHEVPLLNIIYCISEH